jgi:hypothetical protein
MWRRYSSYGSSRSCQALMGIAAIYPWHVMESQFVSSMCIHTVGGRILGRSPYILRYERAYTRAHSRKPWGSPPRRPEDRSRSVNDSKDESTIDWISQQTTDLVNDWPLGWMTYQVSQWLTMHQILQHTRQHRHTHKARHALWCVWHWHRARRQPIGNVAVSVDYACCILCSRHRLGKFNCIRSVKWKILFSAYRNRLSRSCIALLRLIAIYTIPL